MKKYCVILDEKELDHCRWAIRKLDIRNIDIVSNTSKLLRYLVRLGAYCSDDIILEYETKDNLRKEL